MPRLGPPAAPPGTPVVVPLRAGSQVVRLHGVAWAPHAMNRTARPTAAAGGRFDSLAGDYGYLYVADGAAAAIAETLTRELPFDGSPRLVPRAAVVDRVLSVLDVVEDVAVVSLVGPDATHVGQDAWLTTCAPVDYPTTRRWSAAIRSWTGCHGLTYLCRHDQTRTAWALFEAPEVELHPALRPAAAPLRLDRGLGLATVRRVLARHNATIARL